MTTYRIESSAAATGAYEHTAVVATRADVVEHCTAQWRAASVHVVYELLAGIAPRVYAVFVAGRCVSPLLSNLYRK